MESYYLQRRRKHWLLWVKHYDDNWGRWERPAAFARCSREGFGEDDKAAAMILTAAFLREDIRGYDSGLDRFHMITDTGLLSEEELEAVACSVWGNQQEAAIPTPKITQ